MEYKVKGVYHKTYPVNSLRDRLQKWYREYKAIRFLRKKRGEESKALSFIVLFVGLYIVPLLMNFI